MDERKRKRLEAWRKKRQQEKAEVKVSLSVPKTKKRKQQAPVTANPFGLGGADSGDDDAPPFQEADPSRDSKLLDMDELISDSKTPSNSKSKRQNRWDNKKGKNVKPKETAAQENDALDQFMDKLEAGAMGEVVLKEGAITIDVGGSAMRGGDTSKPSSITQPIYQPSDWLSDAPMTPDHEEQEQEGRRALIEALKSQPTEQQTESPADTDDTMQKPVAELKQQVQTEKSRRENRLKELEAAASAVVKAQQKTVDYGRMDDITDDGILEEAQQLFQHAAAPDALTVLAELNKKKELKALDHSTIDYPSFTKNLYRVPRAYASMTNDEVVDRRAKLHVRVRGQGAPAPVETFADMGLSENLLQNLHSRGIQKPYPVQAQCIPCILAGRDVIGIAKTGSGKTLAYALPLLRHVSVQEHSDTPVALILAPARELAFQIHSVCKTYAKLFGLRSTAIYGGAGVAEQIGDLKRGVQICTATPGRLIDLLTLQNGKLLSLQRVTFVVMDEADRMFDMGFAPQISAILSAIRPDRQTLLFSATFPKQIERLARQSLKYPVEVLVGGRSVASDSITQHAELVEEPDKFLRLLQILGEQVEGTKKVIVFVDTQVRSDRLFEQLLRNGYSSLSLHGGKEQEDRDSTLSDFKRKDGPNVLVATGVAARGLDVPACSCVVNFSTPNHLEAYVHQAGRTGRAGNKGVCYTLLSNDEAQFAPIITRALHEAGQAENIDPALKELSDSFKSKVEKGEAKFAGSGFKGKGYSYDSSEMNEAQRMARIEKRQALIEAGLMDADEEDPLLAAAEKNSKKDKKEEANFEVPDNLTPEQLALPGMKEALMRKAGIIPPAEDSKGDTTKVGQARQTPDNHWIQEFEINDYPREALWKVTQKETTNRMQDEFRTAVTVKGSYVAPDKDPPPGERKIYLHMEAAEIVLLQSAVLEIQRLLSEETLRVSSKATGVGSHKYTVI